MSFYEQTKNCGTCKWIDRSVVLTSIPPKARCKLFRQAVPMDATVCLADAGMEKPEDEE